MCQSLLFSRAVQTVRQRPLLHLGITSQDVLGTCPVHETEEEPVHGQHRLPDHRLRFRHGSGHLLVRNHEDSHQHEYQQRLCIGLVGRPEDIMVMVVVVVMMMMMMR